MPNHFLKRSFILFLTFIVCTMLFWYMNRDKEVPKDAVLALGMQTGAILL